MKIKGEIGECSPCLSVNGWLSIIVLILKEWETELKSQAPIKKLEIAVYACNPAISLETGRP